jgi:hypothetical protein
MNEWLELYFMGFPAGRIMMRSEYFPEGMGGGMGMGGPMMMEGGMGGGNGGMGKAVMAGAILGTVAAVEIAEHRGRHRRF